MPTRIIQLPTFTLTFPSLFKPYRVPNMPMLKEKYGCVAVFERDRDLSEVRAIMYQAMRERFGAEEECWGATPLKAKPELFPDSLILNLKSASKPYCKEELPDEPAYTGDEDSFYPGCLCTAEVTPYCYDYQGHRGVAFQLLSITKIADIPVTEEEAALFALDRIAPRVQP